MSNKIYLVRYYIDYETKGVKAIFKNKEDAVKYIEYAEKSDSFGFMSFFISEQTLHESYQEALDVLE